MMAWEERPPRALAVRLGWFAALCAGLVAYGIRLLLGQ